MHLLDSIEAQLISNRLPLVAVTLAAVPYANTPVVLTLHWHGFVETRIADVTDANVVAYQAVPSSALQINERWDRFDELENEVLDVAKGTELKQFKLGTSVPGSPAVAGGRLVIGTGEGTVYCLGAK